MCTAAPSAGLITTLLWILEWETLHVELWGKAEIHPNKPKWGCSQSSSVLHVYVQCVLFCCISVPETYLSHQHTCHYPLCLMYQQPVCIEDLKKLEAKKKKIYIYKKENQTKGIKWNTIQTTACISFFMLLLCHNDRKTRYFRSKHDLLSHDPDSWLITLFLCLNLRRPLAQRCHNIELKTER